MMVSDGASSMLIFWVYYTQSKLNVTMAFLIFNILPFI